MKPCRIQWGITIGAAILALGHVLWPKLAIDAVSVTLLLAAIVPWLAPLFKKLKLPGGWEIEFQALQKAKQRADKAGLLASPEEPAQAPDYSAQALAEEDPNLALAGLRIEIERRLVRLAERHGIARRRGGVGTLPRQLEERQLLTPEQSSVLADMVGTLNSAVHGASVSDQAAEWALEVGPRLLKSLDDQR